MPNTEFQVLVQTIVEAKDVQTRLNAIKDLSLKIEKLQLDQSAIDSIKNQLTKNGINLNLVLGNTSQLQSQATKTGQQIGNTIQSGINQAIQKNNFQKIFSTGNLNAAGKEAEKYFQTLSSAVSIQENLGKDNNLKSFVVTLKNANGVAEQLRYTLQRFDNGTGVVDKWFEYAGGSINDNGVIKQFNSISSAADGLQTKLEKLKANYGDLNAPKAIKDTSHISSLEQQYNKISQAISSLRAADDSTFSSMQSNVRAEISSLENMVQQYRNAEYAATSLRSKDISTTKIDEGNNLEAFVQKMQQSGHYTDELKSKVFSLKTDLANVFDANSLTAYLNKLSNLQSEFKSVDAAAKTVEKSTKLQTNINAERSMLSAYQSELKESGALTDALNQKIQVMYKSLDSVTTQTGLTTWRAELKGIKGEIAEVTATWSKATNIQNSLTAGSYTSQYDSLIAKTNQWTDANGNARISIESLRSAYMSLNSASVALTNDSSNVAKQQALINAEKELDAQIKTVTNSVRSMNAEFAKDSTIATLNGKVSDFISKNGAAMRKFGGELNSILARTAQGSQVTNQELVSMEQRLGAVTIQARQAGLLGKTFFQTIADGAKKFTYWTSSTFLVMKSFQKIKQGLTSIKELDTALVDLKKTTSMTGQELESFYQSSNDVAKQMGVTTKQIIDQASAWSRLGYSSNEAATKMAKLSSQFASISPGMNIDDATDGLVSVMKAYDISEDTVLDDVMSKINIIGNTAATSNDEITNMLKKSSSAMKEANNTLDETIALETAAVEITRDDDSVGTAYKTISMRLRGYDEEVEAYTKDVEELSGEIADLTKTASTPGGISLFTDANKTEFKSTYQLFKEISEIYDDLDDKTQAQLLETIAGKRQGQIVAATLKNFKAAEKAMDDMANSAGSADAEMSIIMDSLEYKLNRLSQTGTGIAQNLFQRDDMKGIVDGLTNVLEVIDKLTDKIGLIGSIGFGAGLFAGIKNVGRAKCCPSCKYAYNGISFSY